MTRNPLFNAMGKPTVGATRYTDRKYHYALEKIVYYSVLTTENSEGLYYYKDGFIILDDDAPAVLRFLKSEFEDMEFHHRFWAIREWVRAQQRANKDCGLEFLHETTDQISACQEMLNGDLSAFLEN
jgi:hypothetical protein